MLKLNLGCGFKKKKDFINVDSFDGCEPDECIDLAGANWPWADSSVDEVVFDFSLEQMGESKKDLFFIIKELYRVCAPQAKVSIKVVHPHHDKFTMNPQCVHPLGPQFLSLLSVSNNLNQIAQGESDSCLGMMWGVNFAMGPVRFIIGSQFEEAVRTGQISENDLRVRMHSERNICEFIEMELVAIKSVEGA
ncbi:class I SAM-dependent methyltransferase [Bdellovibrio svalbardensis]|uniref:Methyltransferase type 11 domain-containing protein n=1 Tax=Bdellovibrio svalbardensis TaxID=2972972 RepID=A0ABT6DG10_9BACT|nr:hypothetical protein [Bdellovibrio svalbardensis]MDG0815786.1 hypothetical protein [Bdellovibrio svalbardensis]